MKQLLLLLLIGWVVTSAQAQGLVAVPLDDVESHGLDVSRLDSLHGSAAHVDPSQSVFPEQQDQVINAWRTLLKSFSEHLKNTGFEWSVPLRGYYRFYFRPEGTIERVLYRVRELEGEQALAFQNALNEFAQSYQFGMAAERGFAQCSPATLMPPSK